ncbi:MAG: thioredoxin family protein [Methanomassiliicoccales archaeon]
MNALKESEKIVDFGIRRFPATVILGKEDFGIRFYGLIAGTEFSALLEDILMISLGQSGLDHELELLVNASDKDVHIRAMASLNCPYCPKMVREAHQFAFVTPCFRADMVEVAEFPDVVKEYEVKGVPRTIINELHRFDGLVPAERLYLQVLKAVHLNTYFRIQQEIRSLEGKRRARTPNPSHEYDVIIIGAGPAGMSATLYAARKGLDVLLLSNDLGGQVNYTAKAENYLGVPEVSGAEMVGAFREHIELYGIAEGLGEIVHEVFHSENGIYRKDGN